MRARILVLLAAVGGLLLLAGCDQAPTDDAVSPLVGVWVTDEAFAPDVAGSQTPTAALFIDGVKRSWASGRVEYAVSTCDGRGLCTPSCSVSGRFTADVHGVRTTIELASDAVTDPEELRPALAFSGTPGTDLALHISGTGSSPCGATRDLALVAGAALGGGG